MRLPRRLLHGNLVISPKDGEWCNGSTTGSEPVSPGSNPGSPVHFCHNIIVFIDVSLIVSRRDHSTPCLHPLLETQ